MENLINRWKTTVDNHNKKLANMRESSLGASSQGRRNSHSREPNFRNRSQNRLNRNSDNQDQPKNISTITDKISKLNNDIEVLSQKSSEKNHAFVAIKNQNVADNSDSDKGNSPVNLNNQSNLNINDLL